MEYHPIGKNHNESTKQTDRKQAVPPAKDKWSVDTPYLKQMKATHRARARAARRWRPRFLKAFAMSCSYTFAAKAARVCYNTVRAHERNDPEFAAQVREAEQEGADLLHHVCWKSALEGNLEPVHWQGEVIGHVRKFDTRLQIEFLRAYMPERFKTPRTNVNLATRGELFVLTEEQRHELMRINREYLTTMPIPTDDPPSHSVTRQPPQLTDGDAASEPTK